MAYVAGAVDPVNRIRFEIGDTAASPTFADAEIQRWIDNAIADPRLLVYLPTSTGGATAATVGVAMAGTGSPAPLQITLTRTIVGEVASVIELAPATTCRLLEDLVNAIGALGRGWRVGFQMGPDREFIDPESSRWIDSLVTVRSLAEFGPSINLALTASARTAYGDEDDAAELRLWSFWGAVAAAMERLDRTGSAVTSRSDGDMRVSFDVEGRLARARSMAARGVFGV